MGAPLGSKNALGNHGGRPTTYTPDMVGKVYEYLDWCAANPVTIGKFKTVKGGFEYSVTETEEKQTAERLPSIAGFARWAKVPKSTVQSWGDEYVKFSVALKDLAAEQERQLTELGRAGEGNSRFAQFLLSATHGYREKTEQDVTSGGKPLVGTINIVSPE